MWDTVYVQPSPSPATTIPRPSQPSPATTIPQPLLVSPTTTQALQLQLWSSDKLRTILKDYSERYLGVKIGISSWRYITVSISRRFLYGAFGDIRAFKDFDSDSDGEGGSDLPWDL